MPAAFSCGIYNGMNVSFLSTKKVILSFFLPFRPEERDGFSCPSEVPRFSLSRITRVKKAFKPAPLRSRGGGQPKEIRRGLGFQDPGACREPDTGSAGVTEYPFRSFLGSHPLLPLERNLNAAIILRLTDRKLAAIAFSYGDEPSDHEDPCDSPCHLCMREKSRAEHFCEVCNSLAL